MSKKSTPLMIGGSDGSGTRSVVALLEKLGVVMIVDDRGTNDVHGQEMAGGGGWPPVVRPVLEGTHGNIDYMVADLPSKLVDDTTREINKFVQSMDRQGRARAAKNAVTGVEYGFKAPVSMCLVPFFARKYGSRGFKFLHVVRDGRDISFSGNQSPVKKFYESNYGKGSMGRWEHMPEVRPMQLWNDWNSDVYAWGKKNANGVTLDTMTVRTEDLIDPSTKFETVRHVAGFVGAYHLTNDELCCMVVEPEEFMGSHSKEVKGRGEHGAQASKTLSKQFGKWQAKLEGKAELGKELHRAGARGLGDFGYEPHGDFNPSAVGPGAAYKCTMTHSECLRRGLSHEKPAHFKNQRSNIQPRKKQPLQAKRDPPDMQKLMRIAKQSDKCSFQSEMDYRGAGIDIRPVAWEPDDPNVCCELCSKEPGCAFFTMDPHQGLCYLKSQSGNPTKNAALFSGAVL